MNTENLKKHIESLHGKIFTATFIKKDGSVRVINARTGVKKHLHGGVSKNNNPNHIIVFDMSNKGYRTIDLENVIELHSQGFSFKF